MSFSGNNGEDGLDGESFPPWVLLLNLEDRNVRKEG